MSTESGKATDSFQEWSERKCDRHQLSTAERRPWPRSTRPASSSRGVRIDRKVELARERLDALGAADDDIRRGLVCIAVLRRDEALVDGILASLTAEREPDEDGPGKEGWGLRLCARIGG